MSSEDQWGRTVRSLKFTQVICQLLNITEFFHVFSLPGFSGPPQRVGPGSDRMTGLAYEEGTTCSNHGSNHASSNSTSNNGTMNYVINPIGDAFFKLTIYGESFWIVKIFRFSTWFHAKNGAIWRVSPSIQGIILHHDLLAIVESKVKPCTESSL